MASTYVNDLRLNEMATGDASGSWGTVTNTNLELIAEAFSFGTEAITTNADTHTTTIADGATDPGRSMFLKYTGTLDSACTITIAPNTVSKLWFIENGTSGSQNILISQGSGANVTIPAGQTKAVYSNGGGSGAAMVDAFATLNVVDLLVDDDLTVTDDVAIGGLATVGETLAVTGVLTTTAAAVFNGGFTSNGDTVTFASANANDPNIIIKNTTNDANAPIMDFITDKGAAGADNDSLGLIRFTGDNDAQEQITFARVLATVADASDGAEGGRLQLQVATHDGEIQTGLLLVDGNAEDEIDVTIGSGTSSNTTIAGDLAVTTNVDLLQGNHIRFKSSAGGTIRGSISAESNDNLQFSTGSSETARMTINTDGKVLIGSATSGRASTFQIHTPASGGGDSILLTRADTNTDQQVGAINFGNNSDSDLGAITVKTDGAANTGAMLFSSAVGGTTAERLRISSTGTVLVATGSDLVTNTAGTSNFRAGVNAGNSIASGGNYNVCIGDEAGTAITTADSNVAVGYQALATEDTLSESVAVGYRALALQNADDSNGGKNVAVGFTAGEAITSGNRNTFVGNRAGVDVDTADGNVAVGGDALFTNTGGESNTAIGFEALRTADANSGFIANTAVGVQAGKAITDGVSNTLIGGQAGLSLASVNYNTAVGTFALDACSHGSQTTAIGYAALSNQDYGTTTTNTANTALGYTAGLYNTSGAGNTFLGAETGAGGTTATRLTTGIRNTIIGAFALMDSASANNGNVIGNGVTGAGGFTTLGQSTDDIRAENGVATWNTVSDERFKKDIVDSTAGLSFIKALKPRTFKYKTRGELPETFNAYKADSTDVFKNTNTNHGFIAQEVKAAIDAESGLKDGFKLWGERADGSQEIGEAALIPMLVKAIQELEARIAVLEG